MTPEERIKSIIGEHIFSIAVLQSELEKLRARIAELEAAQKPDD